MNGYVADIEVLTETNNGSGSHATHDRLFCVEQGHGEIVIDGESYEVCEGFAIVVPGAWSTACATSAEAALHPLRRADLLCRPARASGPRRSAAIGLAPRAHNLGRQPHLRPGGGGRPHLLAACRCFHDRVRHRRLAAFQQRTPFPAPPNRASGASPRLGAVHPGPEGRPPYRRDAAQPRACNRRGLHQIPRGVGSVGCVRLATLGIDRGPGLQRDVAGPGSRCELTSAKSE